MISRAPTPPSTARPTARRALRPVSRIVVPVVVLVVVLVVQLVVVAAGPPTPVTAAAVVSVSGDDGGGDDDDTTRPTVNEFLPEQRPLGDCLSSLPKPDCGSEARGGWRQTAVLLAILAGLAFIAWRVVAASRRARRERAPVTPGTRAATTVPADGDGDPEP